MQNTLNSVRNLIDQISHRNHQISMRLEKYVLHWDDRILFPFFKTIKNRTSVTSELALGTVCLCILLLRRHDVPIAGRFAL